MRLSEPEDENCVSAVLIHIIHRNTYPLDVGSLGQSALNNNVILSRFSLLTE